MDDNFKVRIIDQIQMAKFKKVIDHIRDISYILTDDYSVNVPGDISIDIHGSFKIFKNENAIEVELIDLDPRHKSNDGYFNTRHPAPPNEYGQKFLRKFFNSETYEEFKNRLVEFCNNNGYRIQEYNKGFFIISKEDKRAIKTFESFKPEKITKEEELLVKVADYIKSFKYIIEDVEGPMKKTYGQTDGGLIHINFMLEHNHGYIPGKYHPSDVKLETSGKEHLKIVISYKESRTIYDGQSKSYKDFFESDHYLEFVDRIEGYCDQNGYITYIDNKEKSWKCIYIGVKNMKA